MSKSKTKTIAAWTDHPPPDIAGNIKRIVDGINAIGEPMKALRASFGFFGAARKRAEEISAMLHSKEVKISVFQKHLQTAPIDANTLIALLDIERRLETSPLEVEFKRNQTQAARDGKEGKRRQVSQIILDVAEAHRRLRNRTEVAKMAAKELQDKELKCSLKTIGNILRKAYPGDAWKK